MFILDEDGFNPRDPKGQLDPKILSELSSLSELNRPKLAIDDALVDRLIAAEQFEELSAETADSIHSNILARFACSWESVLDSVARFVKWGSFNLVHGSEQLALIENDPVYREGKQTLHDLMVAQVPIARQIATNCLLARNSSEMLKILASEVNPLIKQLIEILRSAAKFEQEAIKAYPDTETDEFLGSSRGNKSFQVQSIELSLLRLSYNLDYSTPADDIGTNNSNATSINRAVVAALSASPTFFDTKLRSTAHCALSASLLRYAVQEIIDQTSASYRAVRNQALVEVERNNRLDQELSTAPDFDQSYSRIALDYIFFGSQPFSLEVGRGGELIIKHDFPNELSEFWETAKNELISKLKDIKNILESRGGDLIISCETSGADKEFKLKVKFPTFANATHDDCEEFGGFIEHWRFFLSDCEPAMRHIAFNRSIIDQERGNAGREYAVEMSGAGLLTRGAWTNVRTTLELVDGFMMAVPTFDTVSFSATGSAEGISESYSRGEFAIHIGSRKPQSWQQECTQRLEHTLKCRFSWEDYKESMPPADDDDPQDNISLHFEAGVIFNSEIRKRVLGLCKICDPLQLSVGHDQEAETEDGNKYETLLCKMLDGIKDIIEEIKVEGRTKIKVCPIVAFRVAEIGTFDEIFTLEVLDQANSQIVTGQFERHSQQWRWKKLDLELINTIKEKAFPLIDSEEGHQRASFRSLDSSLTKAGVILPESWIFSITESINKENGDPYFGSSPPKALLVNLLNSPDWQAITEDGIIKVNLIKETLMKSSISYGVITQLDGSGAEEVHNFANAKKLHDQKYGYFRPNEAFFRKLSESEENL